MFLSLVSDVTVIAGAYVHSHSGCVDSHPRLDQNFIRLQLWDTLTLCPSEGLRRWFLFSRFLWTGWDGNLICYDVFKGSISPAIDSLVLSWEATSFCLCRLSSNVAGWLTRDPKTVQVACLSSVQALWHWINSTSLGALFLVSLSTDGGTQILLCWTIRPQFLYNLEKVHSIP